MRGTVLTPAYMVMSGFFRTLGYVLIIHRCFYLLRVPLTPVSPRRITTLLLDSPQYSSR